MGCGSSNTAVPGEAQENGQGGSSAKVNGNGKGPDADEISTVVLPETPRKPALAFEIPVEELTEGRVPAPPPRIQKLLERDPVEISLPDIQEKLAEAENRRQTILQQRAASASRRVQKAMKAFSVVDTNRNPEDQIAKAVSKFSANTLEVPQDPSVTEDRNI